MGVKIDEDEKYLYFDYTVGINSWTLVYHKEKDLCYLRRNNKIFDVKRLLEDEMKAYKDVLSYAVEFHHDKYDANEH